MTSITLSATTSYSAVQGSGQSRHHHKGGGLIDDAAKALGMSKDDVVSELKSGKSLGDIADEKGISRDTLADALKKGMPSDLAAGGKADEIVGQIIDRVGMPQRPQGPPPPPPSSSTSTSGLSLDGSTSGVYGSSLSTGQQSTLDNLADLLGTDSSSLLDSLKNGDSLSSMLTSKGVTEAKLAGVLQDGLLIDAKA